VKAKTATKSELRREIEALRSAGQRMANLAFNMSQDDSIDARLRKVFRDDYTRWDAVPRSEKR